MIRLIPGKPVFSKVEFPAYTGLLNKNLNVGYNAINIPPRLELQIRVVYSLSEFSNGSNEWEVAYCQVNYTVIKPKGSTVKPAAIMQVAQDVIQGLRLYLSQVINIERHLLEFEPYPIERDGQIINEVVQELNK